MKIMVSSQVSIESPPEEWVALAEKELKVVNPEYVRVVRFASRFAERPEKHILGYEISQNTLIVPRAWFFKTLWKKGMPFQDFTIVNNSVIKDSARERLTLLPHQLEAVTAALDRINLNDQEHIPADFSIVLATSAGKTITGLALAYACNTPTLIIVPTQEVEKAWLLDAEKYLGLKPAEIGRFRAATVRHGTRLTVASLQTVIRRHPDEWNTKYGLVIFDELHKLNINKFVLAAKNCRAALRVGMTATLKRSDKTMPAILWHVGEPVHSDTTPRNSVPLNYHGVIRAKALILPKDAEWNDLLVKIVEDEERNDMIVALIQRILRLYGGGILVTSCRVEHIKRLVEKLTAAGISTAMLIGASEDREALYEDILAGKYRVTVATQRIVQEGASNPRWHHLVLTTPFNDSGVMEQVKGRPIRKEEGKKEAFLWDIIDNHPIARSTGRSRFYAVRKHIAAKRWINQHYDHSLKTHVFTGDPRG